MTLTKDGVEYEADPRHAEIVISDLGLKEAKGVVAPGNKEEGTTSADHEDKLAPIKATEYRAITARLNYLSPDRPDISFAVKELARSMSEPTVGSWEKLKRLGRYLITRPRMIIHFPYQNCPKCLRVYTDADWAGCKVSRKSTSGGVMRLGAHTIKSWSKTQTLLALSSGESEFYAALKASAEGIGLLS